MAEDPDAYPYTQYNNNIDYWDRLEALYLWPIYVQPVAIGTVLVELFFYNPPIADLGRYGLVWCWITGFAAAAAGLWNLFSYIDHRTIEAAGARAWPAKLAAQREAEAAKRREDLRLQQEAERARQAQLQAEARARRQALEIEARKRRQARLAELENVVLSINANLAAKVDFFGDSDPSTIHRQVCQALLGLGISDLGLLRETQNPAVRAIIGDGSFLPKEPPLLIAPKTPL